MKPDPHLSPRQQRLFFSLGVIYVLIGAAALGAYVIRDVLGFEIGIHGSLMPFGLLLFVGAALLIVGRDENEEKRQLNTISQPPVAPPATVHQQEHSLSDQ